ncbi:MAG: zinc ribbon-containing protein, partial [Methylobacter sp.]
MNKNKLVSAYTDFMKHLHETMEDTLHSFAEALEISKEKTRKDSNLTDEELDRVSAFVKRDVEHAARGLSDEEDKESLSEWFKFDIE